MQGCSPQQGVVVQAGGRSVAGCAGGAERLFVGSIFSQVFRLLFLTAARSGGIVCCAKRKKLLVSTLGSSGNA